MNLLFGYKPEYLFIGVLLLASVACAIDTSTPEFEALRENYQNIAETYPELRQSQLDRMLNQYLENSRERYRQEESASHLAGMGVARQAIRIIEDAIEENQERGDFEITANIREELQEFFEQIGSDRQRVIDMVEQRHDRLRRRTFARFANLAREQNPEVEDELIYSRFEEWIGMSLDDDDENDSEQVEQEQRPRISASQLGVDLFSQEIESLKESFNSALQRWQESRKKILVNFLEDQISSAREWYAEQRRIRNVRGMAVSGNAVNMLEEALDKLKESGEFELPDSEDVRPELKDFLENIDVKMQAALQPAVERKRQLEEQGFSRFKDLVDEQVEGVSADDLKTIFTDWSRGLYVQDEPDPQDPGVAPATAADRLYFAQRGDAEEWFTVGTWQVDSRALSIFEVPVYDGADDRGRHTDVMTRAVSEWSYSHETDLNREHFYAFRLRALPDMKPVDVVSWPSQRNEWALEVRTRREAGKYGFALQAGRTTGPGGRKVAESQTSVPVITEPAGARVFVNGRRYFAPGTDSVTPLNINLGEGRYTIRLELGDHLSETIEDVRARSGTRIQHSFKHVSELPGTRLTYTAGRTWHRTSVEVDEGDKIWITVEGDWVAGFRGEAVGPEGYSREDFPHYYEGEDLRKFPGANYGALLMKIGQQYHDAPARVEDRRAKPVGRRTGISADTWGHIWFDINEKEGQEHRRVNRGALNINIVVLPGGRIPDQ